VDTTKQKIARRKKPHRSKPEEQEGMAQHQHCPPTKGREGTHTDITMQSGKKSYKKKQWRPPSKTKSRSIIIKVGS
jgi:hypothetical protein